MHRRSRLRAKETSILLLLLRSTRNIRKTVMVSMDIDENDDEMDTHHIARPLQEKQRTTV